MAGKGIKTAVAQLWSSSGASRGPITLPRFNGRPVDARSQSGRNK